MIRKMLAAYCCIRFAMPATAQEKTIYPPLVPGKAVQEQLFKMPEKDLKHHFTISIAKGDFLMVEFNNLSDWDKRADFEQVMNTTSMVLKRYTDSLRDELSSKHIDIHIPVKNEPVITRFSQSFEDANLLTMNGTETSALKMSMDTVRILKNIAEAKKRNEQDGDNEGKPVSLQYTFLLRDINTVTATIDDPGWRAATTDMIDSVVNVYKKEWKRPDAWFHKLYVNYNPSDTGKQKLLVSKQLNEEENMRIANVLTLSGGFGVALIRNSLCPNADIGMSYYMRPRKNGTLFTRLSVNTFMSFEQRTDKSYNAYNTSFVNAEVGVESNYRSNAIPFYSVSMGVGYKLVTKDVINRDPSMSYNMYKLFFNYGLSRSIVISPEIVGNFKTKEKYNGWVGLTLNLRLF